MNVAAKTESTSIRGSFGSPLTDRAASAASGGPVCIYGVKRHRRRSDANGPINTKMTLADGFWAQVGHTNPLLWPERSGCMPKPLGREPDRAGRSRRPRQPSANRVLGQLRQCGPGAGGRTEEVTGVCVVVAPEAQFERRWLCGRGHPSGPSWRAGNRFGFSFGVTIHGRLDLHHLS